MKSDIASWHTTPVESVFKYLSVDIKKGLNPEEISVRREKYGKNILEKKRTLGFLGTVLKQFRSPLVVILILAGIATIFLQAYLDSIVIFIALAINVVIGSFQERRSSKAFEKLNQSQEKKNATVFRDGHKMIIPAIDLVPGDIVILEAGMYVPADIRLIEEGNLSVNEAILTGEWIAVVKSVDKELKENTPLAGRVNMVWMGTLVSSGYGRGVVVETGKETQIGYIAEQLQKIDERITPLQQNVRHIARFVIYIISVAIVVIFLLGIFQGQSVYDMLLVSIAVAVASMPGGLPAAVTIVLAIGMESILRKGGLVKNLLAAETLGSTTIILTDKTGTLTEAKMELLDLFSLEGIEKHINKAEGDNYALLTAAVLSSDAFIEQDEMSSGQLTVHGRPIEKSVIITGLAEGITQEGLKRDNQRLDFLQFESSRRFSISLHKSPSSSNNMLYFSGSPELLLKNSSHVYHKSKSVHLTPQMRDKIAKKQEEMSKHGLRFIALAQKEVDITKIPNIDKGVGRKKDKKNRHSISEGITFLGLIAFTDPVRKDVFESIKEVKKAGVRVVMVTGDNPFTAKSIAIETGIAKESDSVLTGADISEYTDKEIYSAVKRVPVFARILPEQKLRIVRILKDNHEVVAMTGDGVNDAPALQSADIGVAVESGTEVAKAASDIILINNSFTIITGAIEEGRRIIDNLKKIVSYLLSTSFSEIIVIGGALVAGAPLPLLPGQILWANIVGEGFMSFSFAFEKVDKDVMKRNSLESISKQILTKKIKKLIAIVGIITGIFLTALYFILRAFDLPIEEIRTIMFVALSIGSIFFAFSFKSLDKPIWKISLFSNQYLLFAVGMSVLLLVMAIVLPPLQTLLSLTTLTYIELLLLVGIGVFNLFVIETVKYFVFYHRV